MAYAPVPSLRVFCSIFAAHLARPSEGEGFIRAETIHLAVALVGHPEVNVSPLPADAVWPGVPGDVIVSAALIAPR